MSRDINEAHLKWYEFKRAHNVEPTLVLMGKSTFDNVRYDMSPGDYRLLHETNDGELKFMGIRLVISDRMDEISFFK